MKMKNRILALFLCLTTVLLTFAGCAIPGGGQQGGKQADNPSNDMDASAEDFIKNGKTDYVVIVPANHSDEINIAESELSYFFKEATGITLSVRDDNNLIFSENSKLISLGNTTAFMQAGLKVDDDLCGDGVTVRSVEKSYFLCGGGDRGTIYSVYKFLSELFGYEYYGRDCYALDKNVTDMKFRSVNIKENPTFAIRDAWGIGPEGYDTKNVLRLYHEGWLESYMRIVDSNVHNCLLYVAGDVDDHKDYWLSASGTNLCLTAHGDPEEYQALLNTIANTVKKQLKSDLKRNKLLISLNDGEPMCNCDACRELIQKYGTRSASNILLCNDVRAMIEDWFHTEEGQPFYRDNFTFGFLAYMDSQDAPVVYNEVTGTYEGRNGIKCDLGVSVLFAPIYNDFTRSIYDGVNKETYFNFKGWDALTDDLYYWGYDMNFRAYYAPYDTLSNLQEMAKFCKECGVKYFFNEGQQCLPKDTTAWANLHIYLNSKIGWDVDCDVQALTEDFFEHFYGPASDTMYDIFSEMRVYTTYLKDTYPTYGGSFSCETSTVKKGFWSKPLLEKWILMYRQALADIDFLREDDPALYNEYRDRVMIEEACPLYLILSLFPNELNADDLQTYKDRFYEITSTLDFIGDLGDPLTSTWAMLGIDY